VNIIKNTPYYRWLQFDGLVDLRDYISKPCEYDGKAGQASSSSRRSASSSWDLGLGWNGTLKMMGEGWSQGAQIIADVGKRYESEIVPGVVRQWEPVHDVTGVMVDVGRYVEGIPECMMEYIPADVQGQRHVHLMVSNDAPGDIESQVMVRRAAAILAIIEALRASGCLCTLDSVVVTRAFNANAGGPPYVLRMQTTLAEPGRPLDMDAIAFGCAHPAFLRRGYFAFAEHQESHWRRLAGVGHGYGAPSDPDDAELQDTLYWPAIHSVYGYTTEQECLQTSLRIAKSKGLLIECQG